MQGDETERRQTRDYLEDRAIGTTEDVFRNIKCISSTTIILPNLLHTVYHNMHKHLMDWGMVFLKKHSRIDKFNMLWVMMPPYPGFAQINKPYSQVTQWSVKQMKALRHVMVPVFTATLGNPSVSQRISFTEALSCINNLVYGSLMAQYRYGTEATIQYMEWYHGEFHQHKDVFSQFRFRKLTKMFSEVLKTQLTLHKQEAWECDQAWNYYSAATERHLFDEDKTQIESEIIHHLVDESDLTLGKCICWTTSQTISTSLATCEM